VIITEAQGGPAFPNTLPIEPRSNDPIKGDQTSANERRIYHFPGMSLRDYFATHCPDIEVAKRIPETMGDILNLLVDLGWVTKELRNSPGYAWNKYENAHMHRLRAWARYQYADAMLEARK
jgi:hypothetical protein